MTTMPNVNAIIAVLPTNDLAPRLRRTVVLVLNH